MENTELKFIEIIKNSLLDNSCLGDDCAYLKDLNLCISTDALVEGVHFDFNFISPYLLAKKALKVNISDILASGAKPMYATITISGKLDEKFIEEFYKGVNEIEQEFGLKIIGGDLTGGEKINISICILGDTKNRNISSRKNAKEGYLLALCGNFGASATGLKMLLKDSNIQNNFTKAHLEPILQFECSQKIAQIAKEPYTMMDSSDGLINALEWISRSSGVGFELEFEKIPHIQGTVREDVLFGGEDYSLVCVLSEKDYKKLNLRVLKVVGRAVFGDKILINGKDIKEEKRGEFLHFD